MFETDDPEMLKEYAKIIADECNVKELDFIIDGKTIKEYRRNDLQPR